MKGPSRDACPAGASTFEDLVAGRRRGVLARVSLAGLSAASQLYSRVVHHRNARYDRGRGVRRLPVPVISVGNITVGGTGKTPVTLWLCEYLRAEGLMPAVVSRGYKATTSSPADELDLVRRRCPQAITVANPDRFEGGRTAIERHKADVILLDDGFQHRRLARDLDIVLIDATCPFGYGRLLPRGLLREPVSSLHRADVLIVTRWDQVSDEAIEELRLRLRAIAPEKTVLRATHRPAGFLTLGGEPIDAAGRFRRPLLFAAIARPAAFEHTVRSMDIEPAAVCWYPDHHVYQEDDIKHLSNLARRYDADAVLTTEKDAVKICRFGAAWPCPAAALRIDIAFLDDDDTIMTRLVREAVLTRNE